MGLFYVGDLIGHLSKCYDGILLFLCKIGALWQMLQQHDHGIGNLAKLTPVATDPAKYLCLRLRGEPDSPRFTDKVLPLHHEVIGLIH